MRKWLIAPVAAIVLLLAAGIAYASIPGPNGVINGCRKNTDGSLRVIDSAATCPSGYTALNWNQTGPQGPAGTNGVSGWEFVVSAACTLPAGQRTVCTVAAPSGKRVLSGGYDTNSPGLDAPTVTVVKAESTSDGAAFSVIFWNGSGQPVDTHVSAIVASVG